MGLSIMSPNWIILGPEKTWKTAIEQGGIWGVKEMLYPEWKALERGDVIFFYVTKTVKGVVGVGKVGTKFIQDKPFWPEEIAERRVIYPLRFEFDIDYIIGPELWRSRRISPGLSISEMRRGVNILQDRTVNKLYKEFKEQFDYTIMPNSKGAETHLKVGTDNAEEVPPDHTKLQQLIFEIGRLNRLIPEKEYPMDNERLDVVWRRVQRSVPTYVFEIQIGGDIYHAIGKLKHAFDIWNSNIFLIAREEDMIKADSLLSGTFHEIKDKIRRINVDQIPKLYYLKRQWVDFEKEIGLL